MFFSYLFDGLDRPVFLFENGMVWHIIAPYTPEGLPALHLLSNGGVRSFGYDGLQRVSAHAYAFAASPGVTWTLARNPAGQIASIARDNDAFAWTGAYTVNRAYTTNGLNQYALTGPPNGAGSVAFTYDANGNLASEAMWTGTTYAVSTTYTYDIENRLVGRSGGGSGATLSYDPLGRLYEVTGGGNTTRFLYDGDALVAEYGAAGAMTRRYAHWFGADVPVVSYQGAGLGQPSQLHADHQGSIVALSNASGAATINSYDEYGIPGAGNTGRFQYTGQVWLAELGMYYYKARVYSPTLGRFLQTDPVGYKDQFNLYTYVGNDPVNLTDPSGMCADRYDDGKCRVKVDRRTGEAGIRAGRELEGVLNRHDAQINALDPNSQHPVYDRRGNVIGNVTGQEIKAVWNGTHFGITSRSPNNGGAGGGIRGAWSGNRFEGSARFTPGAVNMYANAAEQSGRGRQAGVSTLMFHDMAHETRMGNELTNRYPVRSTPDARREQPTSSIGEAMARSVGADFMCGIADCQ